MTVASEAGTMLEAALQLLDQDIAVIDVPYMEKNPGRPGWQNERHDEEALRRRFDGVPKNMGAILGDASNGKVDADLDCEETRALAPYCMPDTGWVFGRKSAPRSHRIYQVGTSPSRITFEDPVIEAENEKKKANSAGEPAESAILLEIRGTGHQTVLPPSTHPSGEAIEWDEFVEEPGESTLEELEGSAGIVAAGALLARYWPAKGKRPAASVALHGGLLRGSWTEAESSEYVERIAYLAGDDEPEKRGKGNALTTAKRLKAKKTATGWPELAKLLGGYGEAIVEKVREWLGMAPGNGKGGGKKGESQSEQLVRLAQEVGLFQDPDGEAFATVPVAAHRETHRVRTKGFRRWIERRFYESYGKPPGSQALQDALGVLEGKALYEGSEKTVHVRLADHEDAIYLDLCNDAWEVVEITPDRWRVVPGDEAPVLFRRAKGMRALPHPAANRSLDGLKRLLNLKDEKSWTLILTWLVACMRPTGPYPVLNLQGEHGTAKSTAERVLRSIGDPSTVPLRTTPRDERDLMITAANGWVVALDNLSGLPVWLSDALCRLSTGGGFGTRSLYSDREEELFDAMRPVILNGISEVASRGDLLDRSLIVEMPVIAEEERKLERELWAAFDREHPAILGALLDAVCSALERLPDVHLEKLPRMADFAEWAVAAEAGLGLDEGAFMSAYDENREAAVVQTLEGDPVAEAVMWLVEEQGGEWVGTPTDLHKKLTARASDEVKRSKAWPSSLRGFTIRLVRLAPALRKYAGIGYAEWTDSDKNRTRKKRLYKIPTDKPVGRKRTQKRRRRTRRTQKSLTILATLILFGRKKRLEKSNQLAQTELTKRRTRTCWRRETHAIRMATKSCVRSVRTGTAPLSASAPSWTSPHPAAQVPTADSPDRQEKER